MDTKYQTIFVTGYNPETRLYSVLLYESPDYFAHLSQAPSGRDLKTRLQKSREQLQNAINELKTEVNE